MGSYTFPYRELWGFRLCHHCISVRLSGVRVGSISALEIGKNTVLMLGGFCFNRLWHYIFILLSEFWSANDFRFLSHLLILKRSKFEAPIHLSPSDSCPLTSHNYSQNI